MESDPNCVFCRIVKGDEPGRMVYRDEEMAAFHDINPRAPVHLLIVPTQHIESLSHADDGNEMLLGKMLLLANKLARDLGIAQGGYKLVINTGRGAGQIVPHLHVHLLGGWSRGRG